MCEKCSAERLNANDCAVFGRLSKHVLHKCEQANASVKIESLTHCTLHTGEQRDHLDNTLAELGPIFGTQLASQRSHPEHKGSSGVPDQQQASKDAEGDWLKGADCAEAAEQMEQR